MLTLLQEGTRTVPIRILSMQLSPGSHREWAAPSLYFGAAGPPENAGGKIRS